MKSRNKVWMFGILLMLMLAQSALANYKAYCDTDPPTQWWYTGKGSVVNRFSEIMDDNPSGVERDDSPGDYIAWGTFMDEMIEDKVYDIHLHLQHGDDSTTTLLESNNELIYFDDGTSFRITQNAKWEVNSSMINTGSDNLGASQLYFMGGDTNAQFYVDNSLFHYRATQLGTFNSGKTKWYNSVITGEKINNWQHIIYYTAGGTHIFNNVYLTRFYRGLVIGGSGVSLTNVISDDTINDGLSISAATLTVRGGELRRCDSDTYIRAAAASTSQVLKFIDVTTDRDMVSSRVGISKADSIIYWQKTLNVTALNWSGAAIANANVSLYGSNNSNYDILMFSALTNSKGKVSKIVTVKTWEGLSETETNYNTFKMNITKSNYLTYETAFNITEPINWKVQMEAFPHVVNGYLLITGGKNFVVI